jgi:hypothetical protein
MVSFSGSGAGAACFCCPPPHEARISKAAVKATHINAIRLDIGASIFYPHRAGPRFSPIIPHIGRYFNFGQLIPRLIFEAGLRIIVPE